MKYADRKRKSRRQFQEIKREGENARLVGGVITLAIFLLIAIGPSPLSLGVMALALLLLVMSLAVYFIKKNRRCHACNISLYKIPYTRYCPNCGADLK